MNYQERVDSLLTQLSGMPGAVVAFSGGVDSSALLFACKLSLGEKVVAVTADSPSLPRQELADARSFAAEIGVEHQVIATTELSRSEYTRNASDRCYFCKTELFSVMVRELRAISVPDWPILYGAIGDDYDDHRPGARAAVDHGVLAPLAELDFTKDEVRRFSREHRLTTADKPSFACLASRVPYGTPVTSEVLARLEQAETVLRELGYRQYRVRHHGTVARVEILPDEFTKAMTLDRDRIVEGVRAAGYTYVALDLQGYRTGSLNEVLN